MVMGWRCNFMAEHLPGVPKTQHGKITVPWMMAMMASVRKANPSLSSRKHPYWS